jgi:hypothetical protein
MQKLWDGIGSSRKLTESPGFVRVQKNNATALQQVGMGN